MVQTEMRCERVRQNLVGRKNFDMVKAFEAICASVEDKTATGDDAIITKDDI